ncbi:TVP38/TMEM64 family protein [Legionella nagasakiensis]|uniref:TVP38/TMEM64 family protein n=1 Tax=Legionella nagasakiensis TaxID=535290 RepID=UPI001F5FEC72|nr:VTT domain-containing protein [Legionella nagasakiensis]
MIMQIKRWGLLVLLLAVLGLFFYFRLYRYLSFESLKTHRTMLLAWMEKNFVQVFITFMAIYIIAVAISIPGATILTVTSGFLFGPVLGTLAVIVSATIGAFIVFLAVDLALREWIANKTSKWLKVMEQGFQKNAFSYLLFLRLIPLFPFWVLNIVPALLGISKRSFVFATFFGIIPGSMVYAMVGNGLGQVIDTHKKPDFSLIFDPKILFPMLALAFLSLLPILYKQFKYKK